MSIKIARTAGFCMGVKRAMEIVLRLARRSHDPIHTDGPLIHNPQIISLLEERGVKPLAASGRPAAGLIVVRAHGVPPRRREELKRIGLPVHDATCPDVGKVQAIVRKHAREGYDIVIVGDRGHAEVEGLRGFGEGRAVVVSTLEEARALPPLEKVCVVAQTTQESRLFDEAVRAIRKRAGECLVFDTICRSTKERQREAIELARRVDLMIVVGGKQSANTARLAKLCRREVGCVLQVESEKDLEGIDMRACKRIGITAGASTPHWVIERVVERLREIRASQRPAPARLAARLSRAAVRSYVTTGVSAAFLYAAVCPLQGVGLRRTLAGAIGAYIMFVHLANRLARSGLRPGAEATYAAEYYRRSRRWLALLAAASGLAGLACAAAASSGAMLFLFVLEVLGLLYCAAGRAEDAAATGGDGPSWAPFFKIFFVPAAWAAAIVLLPWCLSTAPSGYRSFVACIYVLALVVIRGILRDTRNINADTMAGRETIPTLLGVRSTNRLVAVIIAAAGAVILSAPLPAGLRWALAAPLGYAACCVLIFSKGLIGGGLLSDVMDDGQFYIAGLSVALWHGAGA